MRAEDRKTAEKRSKKENKEVKSEKSKKEVLKGCLKRLPEKIF